MRFHKIAILNLLIFAVGLSACQSSVKNNANAQSQNSTHVKNNANAQSQNSTQDKAEEFVAAPNSTPYTEQAAEDIEFIMNHLIDAQFSKGIAYAVITPEGISMRGLGDYAASSDIGSENFEIGSISKVFTGFAMASMINDGVISFDTFLSECMPEGISTGKIADITLGMLATHTSGLPRDYPDTYQVVPGTNHGLKTTITPEQLWAYLTKVKRSYSGIYEYSNLGTAILAHALAICDGEDSWEDLIAKRVTKVLGVPGINTQAPITIHGYAYNMLPTTDVDWSGGGIAPAGALRGNLKALGRIAQMAMSDQKFIGRDMLDTAFDWNEVDFSDEYNDFNEIGLLWMHGLGYFNDYFFTDSEVKAAMDTVINHSGNTGVFLSQLLVSPEAKLGIVAVSNNVSDVYMTAMLAMGYLLGEPRTEIEKRLNQNWPIPSSWSREKINTILGTFEQAIDKTRFSITEQDDGTLVADWGEYGVVTVYPYLDDYLLQHFDGSYYYFEPPAKGTQVVKGFYHSSYDNKNYEFTRAE